jgi:hypothetical protein
MQELGSNAGLVAGLARRVSSSISTSISTGVYSPLVRLWRTLEAMHLVRMFFIEMQGVYTVTFCQGTRQIGRQFRYTDGQRILDIVREAHCPIEDHNLVV